MQNAFVICKKNLNTTLEASTNMTQASLVDCRTDSCPILKNELLWVPLSLAKVNREELTIKIKNTIRHNKILRH